MEPQANYVATGAFVLLVLAGIAAAALWLAGAHVNTRYATDEIRVAGLVGGLNVGAPVRLNGIDVGHVASIRQDARDPQDVLVDLNIAATAVVRSDSAASLEMQGLTGERYVEISGGTLASSRLMAAPGQSHPIIPWRPSSLDALFNNAPEVLKRLNVIAARTANVLGAGNQQAISATLANVSHLTATLNAHSSDLVRLLADGDASLRSLTATSERLDALLDHVQGTSIKVDRLVASADLTFARSTRLINDLDNVVRSGRPGLHRLTTTVPEHLDAPLITANRLTASFDRLSTELQRNPSSVLFGARQEGYRPK